MASIGFAIECPHCGRSAFEDNYYKTDETYIVCYRCGYNYSRTIKHESNDQVDYKEVEHKGHGVVLIAKKDGSRNLTMLNSSMSEDMIESYKEKLSEEDIDLKSSQFVIYENGVFKVLLGSPSENFHLSFKEYKEKMLVKYEREYGDMDLFVPIEE